MTKEEAWQRYQEEIMPTKRGYVYPLEGAFYKTWSRAWDAASQSKHQVAYVCPQCHWTLDKNQKEWSGLSREERMMIINLYAGEDAVYLCDAIEAKLKDKNQ